MKNFGPFVGGLLFGVGLAVSGMTQPTKVIGFLDFGGDWDPSLALVMLGALAVYAPVYAWTQRRRSQPVWAPAFILPVRRDVDARLVGGAALFGIGWGLAGYCPGPAFTSLGARSSEAWTFGLAMVAATTLYQLVKLSRERDAGEQRVGV